MLRLAGMRINPANNGPHRAPMTTGITLRTIATGVERAVQVPAGARIGSLSFSPDGKRFSFTNTRETRIDLYVADAGTAQTHLVEGAVNAIAEECEWLDDSSGLLCSFVPASRGTPPAALKAPTGPNIQESYGKPGPIRTYQDLLTSAHDEDLFEYYFTSQLAYVDAVSGKRTLVGKPGMLRGSPSPNGEYILVRRVKRPFSRLLTWNEFPQDVEIWNRKGEKVRAVADVPMADAVPMHGVITGAAGVSLGTPRSGDAGLGRSARQGRHPQRRTPTRSHRLSESAVQGRCDRRRQDGVSFRRSGVDRQRDDPADRERSQDP